MDIGNFLWHFCGISALFMEASRCLKSQWKEIVLVTANLHVKIKIALKSQAFPRCLFGQLEGAAAAL